MATGVVPCRPLSFVLAQARMRSFRSSSGSFSVLWPGGSQGARFPCTPPAASSHSATLGSRISLTLGLVGVAISVFLGSVIGTLSGYFGGLLDDIIQRVIEFIRSFPTLPLWMALSAALPPNWPSHLVYLGIVVVLSFIGWTSLAREVRGKILSLRETDFVLAAQATGASTARLIFVHMMPTMTSHILVVATLSIPGMILGESTLSFLGLGIKPPLTSWGLLLSQAIRIEVMRLYPWMLSPGIFIAVVVLAFNFFGDGLRDAVDPFA